MSSVNKVFLIGNLGADPEMRTTTKGTSVATLSVATNRKWRTRSGETNEATEWHRVVLWDKIADVAREYLHKGDRVHIEGRIQYRTYEQRGETKYITEIVCSNLTMLGKSEGGGERSTSRPGYANVPDYPDDDLPF